MLIFPSYTRTQLYFWNLCILTFPLIYYKKILSGYTKNFVTFKKYIVTLLQLLSNRKFHVCTKYPGGILIISNYSHSVVLEPN